MKNLFWRGHGRWLVHHPILFKTFRLFTSMAPRKLLTLCHKTQGNIYMNKPAVPAPVKAPNSSERQIESVKSK